MSAGADRAPPDHDERRPRSAASDPPLLVVSCDRYADLWSPFFSVLARQWPDCPFPLFLGTNRKTFNEAGVTCLPVGDDIGWADGLSAMLARLDAEYALVFLDDFFLTGSPRGDVIQRLGRVAAQNRVGCLRLHPVPPPSRRLPDHPELGEIQVGDPYRVSTQVAFWRIDTLRKLLVPGHSPWDFELLGSRSSDELAEPFWSVREPTLPYRHVVERGRWMPEGLRTCAALGIEIDRSTRATWPEGERHRSWAARLRSQVFWQLPMPLQRRLWQRTISRFERRRSGHVTAADVRS
jgi:hypothetical protein